METNSDRLRDALKYVKGSIKYPYAVTTKDLFRASMMASVFRYFQENRMPVISNHKADEVDIIKYMRKIIIPCVAKNGNIENLIIHNGTYAEVMKNSKDLAKEGMYTINVRINFRDGYDSYVKSTDPRSPVKVNAKKLSYQSENDSWCKMLGFKKFLTWSASTVIEATEYLTGLKFNKFFLFAIDTTGRSMNAENKRTASRKNNKNAREFEKVLREGGVIHDEELKKKLENAAAKSDLIGLDGSIQTVHKDDLKFHSRYINTDWNKFTAMDSAISSVILTFTNTKNKRHCWQLLIIY